MAGNLMQVRNIAEATTAVAKGDLSRKITVDVRGGILERQGYQTPWWTSAFAGEVTRVAREVGTEGKLGGQWPDVKGGRNLEGFDRFGQLHGRQPHHTGPNIAEVTTAVARG